MPFIYQHTIRFRDTDAAGVVYFANVLSLCHGAYEESLARAGVDLKDFFRTSKVVLPIVHASVDFLRPLFCGDRIDIHLTPRSLTVNEFEVIYQILPTVEAAPEAPQAEQPVLARALTRHVCIDPTRRQRTHFPAPIIQWLRRWQDPATRPVRSPEAVLD